jgi:hypothetical protein
MFQNRPYCRSLATRCFRSGFAGILPLVEDVSITFQRSLEIVFKRGNKSEFHLNISRLSSSRAKTEEAICLVHKVISVQCRRYSDSHEQMLTCIWCYMQNNGNLMKTPQSRRLWMCHLPRTNIMWLHELANRTTGCLAATKKERHCDRGFQERAGERP